MHTWLRMQRGLPRLYAFKYIYLDDCIIQIYSGITRSRLLKGERYAQRLQKLIYLYLFTDCFMKISL